MIDLTNGNPEATSIVEQLTVNPILAKVNWQHDLSELGIVGSALHQLYSNCHGKTEWLADLLLGLNFGEIEPVDLIILATTEFPLTIEFFGGLDEKIKEWSPPQNTAA